MLNPKLKVSFRQLPFSNTWFSSSMLIFRSVVGVRRFSSFFGCARIFRVVSIDAGDLPTTYCMDRAEWFEVLQKKNRTSSLRAVEFCSESWLKIHDGKSNSSTGSTIRTLLRGKIKPKDWQVLFVGDVGFLVLFRVVSGDYGKPCSIRY